MVHLGSLLWSVQTPIWLMQAFFLVHSYLLPLVKMKYFYRQLQAKNFCSSEIVSVNFGPIKSHHSNYQSCLLVSLPRVVTWFFAWDVKVAFPREFSSRCLVYVRDVLSDLLLSSCLLILCLNMKLA